MYADPNDRDSHHVNGGTDLFIAVTPYTMSTQVKASLPVTDMNTHIDVDGDGSDDSESPKASRKTKYVCVPKTCLTSAA